MRNLTQPTIVDIGTVEVRGQDYYVQRLRYGTHHAVNVFRKGELHRHGLVFQTEAAYNEWKAQLRGQLSLFEQPSAQSTSFFR